MARRPAKESDRLFASRMLHETVSRFESFDDATGLDVMLYWSGKLTETLKLQENYYASIAPQSDQQTPVGKKVQPPLKQDSSA